VWKGGSEEEKRTHLICSSLVSSLSFPRPYPHRSHPSPAQNKSTLLSSLKHPDHPESYPRFHDSSPKEEDNRWYVVVAAAPAAETTRKLPVQVGLWRMSLGDLDFRG